MAFKSEAQVWAEERERVERKRSARGTAFIRWFVRLDPEIDHFVWRAPGEPFPQIGEEG